MRTETLQEIREPHLLFGVADHKGLLRLPDPAGRVALDGRLTTGGLFGREAGGENVKTHDVAHGVVKDEGQEIEVDDGVQARGKIVKQRWKIALLGDGFADLKQGLELTPGMFKRGGERHFRRGDDGFRHRRQDNTWVGGGSTAGERASGIGLRQSHSREHWPDRWWLALFPTVISNYASFLLASYTVR